MEKCSQNDPTFLTREKESQNNAQRRNRTESQNNAKDSKAHTLQSGDIGESETQRFLRHKIEKGAINFFP